MTQLAADKQRNLVRRQHFSRNRIRQRLEELPGRLVIRQQRFDLTPQLLIALTGGIEKSPAIVSGSLQCGMIEVFDLFPTLKFHNHLEICCCSPSSYARPS